MKSSPYRLGFTLIEIISVLVILGILAAVAVPKYFDLQEESERKAAISAVAEAQSRIQLSFGQQLLQGKPCEDAVTEVSEIVTLSDNNDNKFGEFYLGVEDGVTGGTIDPAAGSDIFARRGDTGVWMPTGAKLYLPVCDSERTLANDFMNSMINDLFPDLILNGNDKQIGHTSYKGYEEFANFKDIGNGIEVKLDHFIGNKENFGQVNITMRNANTNEKVFMQIKQYSNGTVDIRQLAVTSNGKENKIVQDWLDTSTKYGKNSSAVLEDAKRIVGNMGLNTDAFKGCFEEHSGEIRLSSSEFKFN